MMGNRKAPASETQGFFELAARLEGWYSDVVPSAMRALSFCSLLAVGESATS